ncbi:2Fe-2S iron-sulfur cluster-binding protein [Cellvibrio sp.]
MNYIAVVDHQNNETKVAAQIGESLMEILRDNLFDVAAICSGAGTCGTCHLHIDEPWFTQLPDRDCYEEDTLVQSLNYEIDKSRLACQIRFEESMHGMRIALVNDE